MAWNAHSTLFLPFWFLELLFSQRDLAAFDESKSSKSSRRLSPSQSQREGSAQEEEEK